jgi:hypothetical protein
MIPCRFIGACAALVGAAVLTAAFAVQDKGKEAKPAAAPSGADPAMMAKWTAFMTPGPDHKVLEPLVGKWTAHVKMWMDPAAPPMESDGTSEIQWIMGNRYLQERHKGTVMNMPFEGQGTVGFDNLKKKYVMTWVDNMGTGIMTAEGTYDPAKKSVSYATTCPDATMSKYVSGRLVDTFVDANTYKMEMFGPDASGKEFRSMEITYTRAK